MKDRILDVTGTILKDKDTIHVVTETLNEYATAISNGKNFIVKYDSGRIDGKITYNKNNIFKKRKNIKIVESKKLYLIQATLF